MTGDGIGGSIESCAGAGLGLPVRRTRTLENVRVSAGYYSRPLRNSLSYLKVLDDTGRGRASVV